MNPYQRELVTMLYDLRRKPTTFMWAWRVLNATERLGLYHTDGD